MKMIDRLYGYVLWEPAPGYYILQQEFDGAEIMEFDELEEATNCLDELADKFERRGLA